MESFVIIKNNDKVDGDKRPEYKAICKDGDKWSEIAGCWLREGKEGNKYFSCKLSLPYKNRKGWKLEAVEAPQTETSTEVGKEQIPF